jgi:DNA-binding YbaB/EbfC family protein
MVQNLAALMMQMEKIEQEVNSRLSGLQDRHVKGEAGGGLVTATGDIWFNIRDLHIDREMLAAKTYDLSTLENLIKEAVNNAIREARNILKSEIGGVIGGQIPSEFSNFFERGGTNG